MEGAHCDRKQAEPAECTKVRLQSCWRWLAGTDEQIGYHTDSLSMWRHGMLLIHLVLILFPSPDPTLTKAVNGAHENLIITQQWCLQVLKCIPFFWSRTSGIYNIYKGKPLGKRSEPQTGHPLWDRVKPDLGLGITLECIQLGSAAVSFRCDLR